MAKILHWGKSPDGNGIVADWERGSIQVYKRDSGSKHLQTWKWEILAPSHSKIGGPQVLANGWAYSQRSAKAAAETRCNALLAGA